MPYTIRRQQARELLHNRIRRVFRAWPVQWTEERLPREYGASARDFVVGDTETRFVVRVVYPDETDHFPRPGAILTTSLEMVVRLCQRNLS